MTQLSRTTCENEYYLNGIKSLPGRLQYKIDPEDILSFTNTDENIHTNGFKLCRHSIKNLQRVIPHTQNIQDWRILLIMKTKRDGVRWMKAALQNKITGKIALLTSTNCKEQLNRPISTLEGSEWFVGHYRMSAPIIFWKELKNRIAYSL